MSKHTPGPWAAVEVESEWGHTTMRVRSTDADGHGSEIAHVWNQSSGVNRANGVLIAAAPDLLLALIRAEAALSDIGDAEREPGDDLAWCESRAAQDLFLVRAVIAKATGEYK